MRDFFAFLNEIRKTDLNQADILSKVNQGVKKDFEQYSFNHIFGNKLRLVIPLSDQDSVLLDEEQIKEALKSQGWEVDFNRGVVWKKIKTNKGVQERKMRLGKLLKRLSKQGDFWQEALHWWELKADKTKKMGKATGVSIIISRSPIDIIRMSDFSEWQSCHAPPNKPGHTRFYSHAVQEAKTGGAIAYVVHNQDLQKIKNLQAKEIFADPDRNIEGICPLERLRLRRFTVYDYNGYDRLDILIPELRSYGIRHLGFVDVVWNWARRVQEPYIDFNNPPDWDSAELHGGNYQDTEASVLWSKFFGVKVDGTKKSVDGTRLEILNRENVEELIRQHKFYHVHIQQYEDIKTIIVSAELHFSFPLSMFSRIPPHDVHVEDDIDEGEELIEFIRDLFEFYFDDDHVDVDLYLSGNNWVCRYYILHTFHIDVNDIEDVEHFLDDLESIDSRYNHFKYDLYKKMAELKYAKSVDEFSKDFNYFTFYFYPDVNAESEHEQIGTMGGVPVSAASLWTERRLGTTVDWEGEKIERSFLRLFPKPISVKSISVKFTINKYKNSIESAEVFNDDVKLFVKLYFTSRMGHEAEFIEFVKNIDKNWHYYRNRMIVWWDTVKKQMINKNVVASENQPNPPGAQITRGELSLSNDEQEKEGNQQGLPDFREWLSCRALLLRRNTG